MKTRRRLSMICMAAIAAASVITKPAISAPLYTLTKIVPLGNGGHWDYLHYDPSSARVYISHGTEIIVLDAKSGKVVGHVAGIPESHGIAISSKAGFGYADSRKDKDVVVFDLKTLQPIKTIGAIDDADGMAYDSANNQVYLAGGDANAVLAINAGDNTAAKTIDLGGAPEFLVSDGAGSLYVNLSDKNEIARIDTESKELAPVV